MNRAKILAATVVIAAFTVGGLTYNVLAPKEVPATQVYADAGVTGPNRILTCPIKVDEDCRGRFGLKKYETVRIPVFLDVEDGGISNVLLPPNIRNGRCIQIPDFSSCELTATTGFQPVVARWNTPVPLVREPNASKFVIPDCRNPDGGWNDKHAPVACTRATLPDGGGLAWKGCNIIPRAQAVGGQCLPAPSGVLLQGDRLEDSL